MSYDKAVANLLEAAGDYNATVASFSLETTMYAGMRKTAREKMKQAIESLSLGSIHLTLDETDSLSATVDGWDFKKRYTSSLHNIIRDRKLATEEFKKHVEQLLVATLSNALYIRILTLESISKFTGYARLLLTNVDDDTVKIIRESYDTYLTAGMEYKSKSSSFLGYYNYISILLGKLSREWLKEKVVYTPGMKIGVTNLRTGKSVVRTIKRCSITDESFSITLNGSSSVITDPARINKELTWYFNADEYTDIAKVIKWKPIADFI